MRLLPRLASGLLAVVLLAPAARADEAAAAGSPGASSPGVASSDAARGEATRNKIPLRVVRVMPESRQALLFDRTRATHVLAEIGAKLDGYTVADIDEDSVTLARDGREIVLVAPASGDRPLDRDAGPARSARPASASLTQPALAPGAPVAPIDPYDEPVRAAAVPAPAGPVVPPVPPLPTPPGGAGAGARVGGDGGIRVVSAAGAAPSAPGEGAIRVVTAPASPAANSLPVVAPAPRMDGSPGVSGAPASPIRAVSAAGIQPASATRPDKATLDARALADAMADQRTNRAPQTTDVANSPTRAAEVRVTSAASDGGAPRSVSLRDGSVSAGGWPDDRGAPIVITRGELDRALADFAALSAGIRASFSASGVTVTSVSDGTIFQRAGLRAGDVITSVDGQRVRSLDDAANLYARASAIKSLAVQIVRAGQPTTLRVVIQ